MNKLNDELNEMLSVAGNTRIAMQEVNDAFAGDSKQEYNFDYDKDNKLRVKKKKIKRGHSDARPTKTALP